MIGERVSGDSGDSLRRRAREEEDGVGDEPVARRRRMAQDRRRGREDDDVEPPERRRMRLEMLELEEPVSINAVFGNVIEPVEENKKDASSSSVDIAEIFSPLESPPEPAVAT